MLVDIKKVRIIERIRKDIGKIDELANDIKRNGLINPITLMQLTNGEFQLLAGLRRLRACEYLKQEAIQASVVEAKDAEAALNIEYSENEQREDFTISERLDYARLIEEIEKAKAKDRQLLVLKQNQTTVMDHGPQRESGSMRDTVAEKVGLGSGRTYDRVKYIAKHGGNEVLEQIDNKKISIRAAYEKIKSDKQSGKEPTVGMKKSKKELLIMKLSDEELSKNQHFTRVKEKLREAEIAANLANTARNESERNCELQLSHLRAQIIGMGKHITELEEQLKCKVNSSVL